MYLINKLIAASTLLALSSAVYAIDPSSNLPIEIESDSASLDDQSGISIYSGNVIVSQGLSRLEAEEISVKTNNRQITSIEATGEPAHFVQQDNPDTPATHGYGKSIIYLAKDNLIRFSGTAKLVQHENSFSGEQIEYDIVQRAIRAKGDQAQGSRVKIHYYPQTEDADKSKEESASVESASATTHSENAAQDTRTLDTSDKSLPNSIPQE